MNGRYRNESRRIADWCTAKDDTEQGPVEDGGGRLGGGLRRGSLGGFLNVRFHLHVVVFDSAYPKCTGSVGAAPCRSRPVPSARPLYADTISITP